MVNIIVSTKVNNKWVMLVILIIFDVNKSHVTILSDLCIVAVVKYLLHNCPNTNTTTFFKCLKKKIKIVFQFLLICIKEGNILFKDALNTF